MAVVATALSFPSDGEWVSCRSAFLCWAAASGLRALWLPAAVSRAVALEPGCCWCRAWQARGEVVHWRLRLSCGAWGKRRGGGRAREEQVEAASLTRATGRWSGLKLNLLLLLFVFLTLQGFYVARGNFCRCGSGFAAGRGEPAGPAALPALWEVMPLFHLLHLNFLALLMKSKMIDTGNVPWEDLRLMYI